MLTIYQIPTNYYTSNNYCRKPCFKAGISHEALIAQVDALEKELYKSKKVKPSFIQWFQNLLKSCKANNTFGFAQIDSPIGKLKLSSEGIKQYAEVVDLYAEGLPQQDKYYEAETEVIKAKLKMEVLGSLGELSTKYNDVIKSKTFGKIKVTEDGLEQYLDAINLYAEGLPRQKKYYNAETEVIKAKLMMEVLGSLGELSTKYNDVIKSKTFGKIKVTEKGLKQYIDAMNLYAEAFPWQKIYPDKKQNVIKAEQMINIIKGNGELPEDNA